MLKRALRLDRPSVQLGATKIYTHSQGITVYFFLLLFLMAASFVECMEGQMAMRRQGKPLGRSQPLVIRKSFEDYDKNVEIVVIEELQTKAQQDNAWAKLMRRACIVLRQSDGSAQDALFTDVIEQMIRSSKNPITFDNSKAVLRLMHMAVYFKNNNLKENPRALWQGLIDCHKRIQGLKYHALTEQDKKMTLGLYKHESLPVHLSEIKKQFVPHYIANAFEQYCPICLLTDTVCAQCSERLEECWRTVFFYPCCAKQPLDQGLCMKCGDHLKKCLTWQLWSVVLGFHNFGFPLGKSSSITHSPLPCTQDELEEVLPESIDLVRWAIGYYDFLSKKEREHDH